MPTNITTAAGRGTLSAAARSLARKPITSDAVFTPEESALLYHAVTGVCPSGAAEYLGTLALPDDTLATIADIARTVQGQPGHEKFAQFAASDVAAAAPAIQAAVDLIPGDYFATLSGAAEGGPLSEYVRHLPKPFADLRNLHDRNLAFYQDKAAGTIRDCTADDKLTIYISTNTELKVSGLRARRMEFESSTSALFYAGSFAGGAQNFASELVDIKISTGQNVRLAASSPVFSVDISTVNYFRLRPENGESGFTINYRQMTAENSAIVLPIGSSVKLIGKPSDTSKVRLNKVPQKDDAPIVVNVGHIDTGSLLIMDAAGL